ncbi:uncharacterized protein LOC119962302 [Scyliorhinus canicula]|uniref:uncharacterized protein LOC119962302 n=1 Tax=Scyliorhinus canicula TaxID=7830 RepID=UPI0018F31045|nr:uncharacterized protein LOC119962302 [Scyliorhinus canicula]
MCSSPEDIKGQNCVHAHAHLRKERTVKEMWSAHAQSIPTLYFTSVMMSEALDHAHLKGKCPKIVKKHFKARKHNSFTWNGSTMPELRPVAESNLRRALQQAVSTALRDDLVLEDYDSDVDFFLGHCEHNDSSDAKSDDMVLEDYDLEDDFIFGRGGLSTKSEPQRDVLYMEESNTVMDHGFEDPQPSNDDIPTHEFRILLRSDTKRQREVRAHRERPDAKRQREVQAHRERPDAKRQREVRAHRERPDAKPMVHAPRRVVHAPVKVPDSTRKVVHAPRRVPNSAQKAMTAARRRLSQSTQLI